MGLVSEIFPAFDAGVANVIWGLGTVLIGIYCIWHSIVTVNGFFAVAGLMCFGFALIPLRETPQSVRGFRGIVRRFVYFLGMGLTFFVYGMGVVSMR